MGCATDCGCGNCATRGLGASPWQGMTLPPADTLGLGASPWPGYTIPVGGPFPILRPPPEPDTGGCECKHCSVRGLGGSYYRGYELPVFDPLAGSGAGSRAGAEAASEVQAALMMGASPYAGMYAEPPTMLPASRWGDAFALVDDVGTLEDRLGGVTISGSVDIYLSAGEHRPTPESSYESCDWTQEGTCGLYRVSWHLRGRATSVERIASPALGIGWVQPALSPDRRRLAYLGRIWSPGATSASYAYLTVKNLRRGTAVLIDGAGAGDDRPQFPNWISDDHLLYHKTAGGVGTLWLADRAGGWSYPLLGPGGWLTATGSYKDANTAPDGIRIATFGAMSDGYDRPQTHRYDGSDYHGTPTFAGQIDGRTIRACHHPAWSPAGDRLLCTNQSDFEVLPSDSSRQRLLYTYRWDGSAWVADGAAFEPMAEADLQAFLPTGPDTRSCLRYTYKYAEWCGSEDYIVATLFCDDGRGSSSFSAVSSRIVLIKVDLTSRAIEDMWDVTAAVEAAEGYALGELRSVFATCGARRGA